MQTNIFIIIKGGEVYSPKYIGRKDLLIGSGKILAVKEELDTKIWEGFNPIIIEAQGKWVSPGLIDGHIHMAGAGGEGGPATRTPEVQLVNLIEAGVTSVIGCLGTDGFARSPLEVLMKVKSIRAQGLSAWMLTGAYQLPTPTITGDVAKDIIYFEEIIGAGEIAISDHRSSNPSFEELAKFAAHVRVAGMLGGCAGIINFHMGDAQNPFVPLYELTEKTMIPLKQFLPTHINRNEWIFKDAIEFGKKGRLDITTSSYPYFADEEIKPSHALKILLENGVPPEHITFSSDACGSLPSFDPITGDLIKLDRGLPVANLNELRDAVFQEKISLETALSVLTQNPARIFKLPSKGQIQPGADADLLIFDENLELRYVIAQGQIWMENGKIIRSGNYE
ncbi:MAG: beta-aspartyl-peptidase [Bacteroidales bacterium]